MQVGDRADLNFSAHITAGLNALPGATIRTGDLTVGDSGLACDTFNVVACARFTSAAAPGRIRETVAHFRDAGRPFSWWAGPADQPANLRSLLESASLVPAESEQAMALELSRLESVDIAPGGLAVRRATTPAELAHLARIHGGWAAPDPAVTDFYRQAATELLAPASPRWFYVGYLGDEPVAAAEVTVIRGVAGLYGVMAREEFRGRGFGLALSAAPLYAARAAGADLGVLQAAEGVDGLYRRLGFSTFGAIREYKPA